MTTSPDTRAPRALSVFLILLAIAGAVGLAVAWEPVRRFDARGLVRLADRHDLGVCWESSRWVVGDGVLYRDVASEYPLAANLLFGAVRAVAERVAPLADPFDRFAWWWMVAGWATWLATLYVVWARVPGRPVLLWLTPAALHFSLLRFDVYPVLASLLAVLALRETRWRRAAMWLGIAIALKGYAMFVLPAWAVYVAARAGWREAALTLAIALGPWLAGNIAVLAFAGVQGMLSAYAFHAARTFNGESTYDALGTVFGPGALDAFGRAPIVRMLLALAGPVFAVAMRPRTFEELMLACVVALLGLVSFSVFYSPQFVLWIVPFAMLAGSRLLATCAIALSWLTYLYFPVLYFRERARGGTWFEWSVVAVAALRLVTAGVAATQLAQRRAVRAA